MSLLKQHEEILIKLTNLASKEETFNERGQFMNIQKMIYNELEFIKDLKELDIKEASELVTVLEDKQNFISKKMIEDCIHPIDLRCEDTIKVISIVPGDDKITYYCQGVFNKKTERLLIKNIGYFEMEDIKDFYEQYKDFDLYIFDMRVVGYKVKEDFIKLGIDVTKTYEYLPTRDTNYRKYLNMNNNLICHNLCFCDIHFNKTFDELLDFVDTMKVEYDSGIIKIRAEQGKNVEVFESVLNLNYYCGF